MNILVCNFKKNTKPHGCPTEYVNLPLLAEKYRNLLFGCYAIQKLCADFEFKTVLDIGSGAGEHTNIFLEQGKKVTAIDFGKSIYFNNRASIYNYIQGNYNLLEFEKQFDAILGFTCIRAPSKS